MPTGSAQRVGLEALRGLAANARRIWDRASPRARWLTGGAVIVTTVLAVAFHPHLTSESPGYDWLYGGKEFPPAQTAKIIGALRGAEIACESRGGRVSVPAGRMAEALAVLARAKLGPREWEDLLDESAAGGSFWDGPNERERLERRSREKAAREAISEIKGVESATVIVRAIEGGTRLNPARRLQATALVRAESGQPLSHRTVEMIRNVLTSIGGVEPTAVTLLDPSSGREYLVAGRPDVEARSTVRVREEEIRERILEQLQIEGALVSVRIDAGSAPVAVSRPIAAIPAAVNARPHMNQPIGEIEDVAPANPAPAVAKISNPARDSEGYSGSMGRATVLVRIPKSYYLRLYHETHGTSKPSADDLVPYVSRVSETVRVIVGAVVGPAELQDLRIDRLDDLATAWEPTPASVPTGRSGLPVWVGPTLAGLFVGLCIVLVGGRWLVLRGPAGQGRRPAARRRVSTVAESGAAPSERVRSLVRLDPAAAGGVLHRWIAQGSTDR